MRSVDDEEIDPGGDERGGPLSASAPTPTAAPTRSRPWRPWWRWGTESSSNVLDGDQPGQVAPLVDDRQLLDAVPVRIDCASSRVVPAGAVMRFAGHHRADRLVDVIDEADRDW